jgi:tRNA pseudouridine38-40 synthase
MARGIPDGEPSRWKCLLAYDGTEFAGWQKQPSGLAVQDKVEEALVHIFGSTVRTIGSGRTDAGVHAKGQIFHFDAPWTHPASSLLQALRTHCPTGISPRAISQVPGDFHALLSAQGKRYCYRACRGWAMPEVDRFIYSLKEKTVDLTRMQEAAKVFIGEHDFSSFSASRGEEDRGESKVRKVWKVNVVEVDQELQFIVEGGGFLYKMVRGMVGALFDVGAGKLLLSDIEEIFNAKKRTGRIVSAPAKGLCLEEVFYHSSK